MAPKVVVLCGGTGTRAYPQTADVPKPLLVVGDRPILRHVMDIYAAQGFCDFVLAAGHKAALVQDFAASVPHGWTVEVLDTGEHTGTAARLRACAARINEPFVATYGDGVADIDLGALLAFHRDHPGRATLTTVALPSPFGTIDHTPEGRVTRFQEKPRLEDHRINAGFFVFDGVEGEAWAGDDLERDVLPALADASQLFAYHHPGFWRSMDTYKDAVELSAMCESGSPPWKRG